MEITLKPASKSDTALIFELAEKIWHNYYPDIISVPQIDYMLKTMYSTESLIQQMHQGQQFLLAYIDNNAVGYISTSERVSGIYFLHKFYVDLDQHRKGIGKEIWNQIEMSFKNPCMVELTVNRKNIKAINFYFKIGFIIKEVADFDIGGGYFMNDFIMIKNMC